MCAVAVVAPVSLGNTPAPAPVTADPTTVVRVGAPGGASGNTTLSQHYAQTRQGASGGLPYLVSRRSGEVAATVRLL